MVVVSVSVSEFVGVEPSVPGMTAVPEGDSAGTHEPPAEDTYSSTVVYVPTRVEVVVSTPTDSAVTEQAAQHFPASEQSTPELTASTVVNSVFVPSTTTSPVDVEYASTITVSMVVDIVRDNVAI